MMIRFLFPILTCVLGGMAQPSSWTQYTNGNDVLALATSGRVAWVGTTGGLVRLDLASGDARFFNTSNSGLLANTVTRIQVDGQERVWAMSAFGTLHRFDGSTWTTVSVYEPMLNFLVLRSGEVAACRQGGLQIFDGTWRQVDTLRRGQNHCELAQGPGNEFWLSQRQSMPQSSNLMDLTRYDVRTWTATLRIGADHPSFNGKPPLVGLLPDSDGTLWAGSGFALLHIGDSLLETPVSVDGQVASLIRGADGKLWAGTDRGLARRDSQEWTFFQAELGQLPSDRIRALARDGSRLLIGTDSGLATFTPDEWRALKTSSTALPSNSISALYTDPGGDMWIGTYKGILRRRDTAWSLVREGPASRPPDDVTQFLSARDGSLWMATRDAGVIRLRNGAWSRFPLLDGDRSPSLLSKCMAEDGTGRIWIALGEKLAHFDGTRWTDVPLRKSGLEIDRINTLESDGAGVLWAAGDGLARFDGFAWNVVNREGIAELAWEPRRGQLYGMLLRGPAKLEGADWKVLPVARAEQPNESHAFHLTPDRRGRVWFAYSDTGFQGLGWTEGDSIHLDANLPPFIPYCLGFDNEGRLWEGSDEGLAMRIGDSPVGRRPLGGAGRMASKAKRLVFPGERLGESVYDITGRYLFRERNGLRAEKVYFDPVRPDK